MSDQDLNGLTKFVGDRLRAAGLTGPPEPATEQEPGETAPADDAEPAADQEPADDVISTMTSQERRAYDGPDARASARAFTVALDRWADAQASRDVVDVAPVATTPPPAARGAAATDQQGEEQAAGMLPADADPAWLAILNTKTEAQLVEIVGNQEAYLAVVEGEYWPAVGYSHDFDARLRASADAVCSGQRSSKPPLPPLPVLRPDLATAVMRAGVERHLRRPGGRR